MTVIIRWASYAQKKLQTLNLFDFLGPLAFRLYLAPIFLSVGINKATHFNDIVSWFQNGLELPFPWLMAVLAIGAEIGGGIALLLGLALRWMTIPLIITMLVATFSVHWTNGWFAVAPSDPQSSLAAVLAPIGFPGAQESLDNSVEV